MRLVHRAQSRVHGHPQEGHEPGDKSVARPFDYPEERSHERAADNRSQCPSFERVGDEQFHSAFVEAMLLLEYECLIVLEWERWDAS